jgi:hypothetical protein
MAIIASAPREDLFHIVLKIDGLLGRGIRLVGLGFQAETAASQERNNRYTKVPQNIISA